MLAWAERDGWITATEDGGQSAGATALAVPALAMPHHEPELGYLPGTPERARLDAVLRKLAATRLDLPLVVGGREIRTGEMLEAVVPHRHAHVLADVHQARSTDVVAAIDAARQAWQDWHRWSWTDRAAVFLRAAALASGPYRERLVAATMLDQSKTVAEAEADAACELSDFLRFNVSTLRRVLEEQPPSTQEAWNRMEYRALEGFVYAVTPFNFTAIGANLPTTPALMGNTVVWKPSAHAMVAAAIVMELLGEAGLPDGVINLVYGDPELVSSVVLDSPHLAAVHFTGSTAVFRRLWAAVGRNIGRYRSFPRLIGETGGKDFVLAHASADVEALAAAVVRGAFEYQGQKCSAASRLYVPASLWPELTERLREHMRDIRMGDVADPSTYVGAVISASAFERHSEAIAEARKSPDAMVLAGGSVDDAAGWFVEPTLIEVLDPRSPLLRDELFGPIVSAYVYEDAAWPRTLELVDCTSEYALTGSIFATDRCALGAAESRLEYAAGNLYLNDKPTGAIVGQQPFGGSRGSGTNDKTGTPWHLARWVTPRTVKETLLAPRTVPRPRVRTDEPLLDGEVVRSGSAEATLNPEDAVPADRG
jgi:1-pyrroline-5-carboxylate dehydrogenase